MGYSAGCDLLLRGPEAAKEPGRPPAPGPAGSGTDHDSVNHPKHYNANPSGIEAIDVIEHLPFNIGTAMKYLWRCGLKGDAIEDLRKSAWYIDREIARREKETKRAD
jgi:hypothetical protein